VSEKFRKQQQKLQQTEMNWDSLTKNLLKDPDDLFFATNCTSESGENSDGTDQISATL